MTKIFVGILLTLTALPTQAQVPADPNAPATPAAPTTPAVNPPATLAGVMKAMSATLKKITAQAADAGKNADSAKLTQDLIDMTKNSKNHIPPSIKNLPKDQLKVQQDQYLKMIDDSLTLQQELLVAFQNNDNTKAADALNKINASKKEGHNAFK